MRRGRRFAGLQIAAAAQRVRGAGRCHRRSPNTCSPEAGRTLRRPSRHNSKALPSDVVARRSAPRAKRADRRVGPVAVVEPILARPARKGRCVLAKLSARFAPPGDSPSLVAWSSRSFCVSSRARRAFPLRFRGKAAGRAVSGLSSRGSSSPARRDGARVVPVPTENRSPVRRGSDCFPRETRPLALRHLVSFDKKYASKVTSCTGDSFGIGLRIVAATGGVIPSRSPSSRSEPAGTSNED